MGSVGKLVSQMYFRVFTLTAVSNDAHPSVVLTAQVPLLLDDVTSDYELIASASQPRVRWSHNVSATDRLETQQEVHASRSFRFKLQLKSISVTDDDLLRDACGRRRSGSTQDFRHLSAHVHNRSHTLFATSTQVRPTWTCDVTSIKHLQRHPDLLTYSRLEDPGSPCFSAVGCVWRQTGEVWWLWRHDVNCLCTETLLIFRCDNCNNKHT